MTRPPIGFYEVSTLARKHFNKRPTQHNLTIDIKQIGSKVLSVKSKWKEPNMKKTFKSLPKNEKLYGIFQMMKNARVEVLDQVIDLLLAYSRKKK